MNREFETELKSMDVTRQADEDLQDTLKMTTTNFDGQKEINAANGVRESPTSGQLRRAMRRRSKKPWNFRADKSPSAGSLQGTLRCLVARLLLWSKNKTFNLGSTIQLVKIICLASLLILNIKCDDELQQNDVYDNENQQQQQQQNQVELFDLLKQQGQRDPRSQLNLDDLVGPQDPSATLGYNLINPTNEFPMAPLYNHQLGDSQQGTSGVSGTNQQQDQLMHAVRGSDLPEADQLETAQTKAESNSVAQSSKTSEGSGKAADAPASTSSGQASPASPTSSSSSTTSSLSEHLSAVNNLIHQAGQIGLTAAQQNVALSEAIINSVTNSLVGNRKQNAAQSAASAPQVQAASGNRPAGSVGQSIDGSIDYNPNSNTIDGFINIPTNFSGSKPTLSAAMKPLLLAAIKTVPLKVGSVGWKILKLLAWKKIYKAHHPKSGEIIIEQEMKHGGHGGGEKGGKLGSKISDHFESKFKTSKMGQSYMSGGNDDWMSMMKHGGGGDMFSGGWSHGDSHAASPSMIYQRHLLPPGATSPLIGGGAGHQQAAAVAAAAAATAAAIQSHWQQQQQQQAMAEETSESQLRGTNQTSGASQNSQGGGQNALRRKKATFGGNWFAATPAHAYAAAAAAANAAAAMASQQQQQQQQRLSGLMRAYELGGQSPEHMPGFGGPPNSGGGLHHALATGLMYQSLFDNAAAMAVQNTVRLPTMDHQGHNQNPLANAEFLDQSDSLSASSFGSFPGGGTDSMSSAGDSIPLSLMQRHDLDTNPQLGGMNSEQLSGRRPSTDSLLTLNENYPAMQLGPRRSGSLLESMPDFDDTPAGKLIGNALNGNTSYPVQKFMSERQNVIWN